MNRLKKIVLLVGLLAGSLLGSSNLMAQGVISDGTFEWEWTAGVDYPFSNFTNGTADHLHQFWWWYRIDGDTQETPMPWPPTSQDYTLNAATLAMTTASFDVSLVATITANGVDSANVVQQFELTNTTTANLNMTLFSYADFDVTTSINNNAVLFAPNHTRIDFGVPYSDYLAPGADHYEAANYAGLRTRLQDTMLTDLPDLGLPFGPGDYTGAYQWELSIPAGETETVYVVCTYNEEAVAPTGGPVGPEFIRGDCTNDGGVSIPDVIRLLGHLFPGTQPVVIDCMDACDADDNGALALPDAINMLNALFASPIVPLPEPSSCGEDPTDNDLLDCAMPIC